MLYIQIEYKSLNNLVNDPFEYRTKYIGERGDTVINKVLRNLGHLRWLRDFPSLVGWYGLHSYSASSWRSNGIECKEWQSAWWIQGRDVYQR